MANQNTAPLKFDQKPSEATFSPVFSNFNKCQPEVADDVISGAVVDLVDTDFRVRFGDSKLNSGRAIKTLCRPDPFYTPFLQYSIAFCS